MQRREPTSAPPEPPTSRPRPRQTRAPKASSTGARPDWLRLALESLEHFAEELPSRCDAAADDLHRELSVAFLQLAITAIEDGGAGGAIAGYRARVDASAQRAFGEIVGELRARHGDWSRAARRHDWLPELCFSVATLQRWLAWTEELAARATHGVDGPVRELGALHELLLEARLERLSHAARRVRKTGAWLELQAVLSWPREQRTRRAAGQLGLSKASADVLRADLTAAATPAAIERALAHLLELQGPPRSAQRWVLQPSLDRRRTGSHYTPWTLSSALVQQTLAPLLRQLPQPRSRALLALEICDPAMGAGAFLIAAADQLSKLLECAWRDEGHALASSSEAALAAARREIATCVLFGVDKNLVAAHLARAVLSLFAFGTGAHAADFEEHVRCGDALVGKIGTEAAGALASIPEPGVAEFDWPEAFPQVFRRAEPGFSAVLGNPPWVAYVGRAAQPLAPELAEYYAATSPAFRRYRTLHGLFVYRAATLLRPGGRLGLILPTSVADLEGYGATRAAHDGLCDVDAELPDWGDGAFRGVFQPSMALLSTRRRGTTARGESRVWPLENHDLTAPERCLLERLRRLPPFPPEHFGERGFQTLADDQTHLARVPSAPGSHWVPLLEGADIAEFSSQAPRLFADARALGGRLRPPSDWASVKIWIRQTARFPIAVLGNGTAFRNSILAGFASPPWPAEVLVCYLNSSLARWLHYSMHRDARQGMPQLKVGHLRALPALPGTSAATLAALARLGAALGAANCGISSGERAELDELIAVAFALSSEEQSYVARWAAQHPPPVSRRQRSSQASDPSTGGPSDILDVAALV